MECFLTKSTANLVKIEVDGMEYWIDEEKHSDFTMKVIKDKIRVQRDETLAKKEALKETLAATIAGLGMSKEELIKLLGGSVPGQAVQPRVQSAQPSTHPAQSDEGFIPVPGTLASKSIQTTLEEGVPPGLPAYSKVVVDGKEVVEDGKMVKKLNDNTIVSRSSLGETVVAVIKTDAKEFNERATQTDDYDLVRKQDKTRGCPLCKGSCFIQGNKVCPKCKGTGFIYINN